MTFTGISPRWWLARQIEIALLYGIPMVAAAVVAFFAPVPGSAAVATLAALAICAWFIERGRFRRWGYAERGSDLVVQRGFLFHRLSIVPYGRMQFIDVEIGPVERMFGLATVQLHTAAAASDARIPGLPRAEANRLRDRLTELGESNATGL